MRAYIRGTPLERGCARIPSLSTPTNSQITPHMTVNKIPIWLDCDPGHDDAVAILLACFHPAFDLRGISACYGNASQEHTDYNARSLITAMGKSGSVPVYKGAARPWIREPHYAPDIHGESGLDGTTLLPVPLCEDANDTDYIHAIEREILACNGELTLLCTGAMTGAATLMKEHPKLRSKVKYLSIMGGGVGIGNINDNMSAEFNAWIDPHAANFLFHDPILKDKTILCPLNLTHTAIATKQVMDRIIDSDNTSSPSNFRKMFHGLFQFFEKAYFDQEGFTTGPPIHDPMTLYPLLELYGWESNDVVQFECKRMDIDVIEDLDSKDVGKLIVKKEYPLDAQPPQGIRVGFKVNIDYYWKQFFMCLDEAEKCSTIENK